MSFRFTAILITAVLLWTGVTAPDPVAGLSAQDSVTAVAAAPLAIGTGRSDDSPSDESPSDSRPAGEASALKAAPGDLDGDADLLSDLCPVSPAVHTAVFSMESPSPDVLAADPKPYNDGEQRPPRAQRQAA